MMVSHQKETTIITYIGEEDKEIIRSAIEREEVDKSIF